MTREQMLRAEVGRRLAAAGHPSDNESVSHIIKGAHIDAAFLLGNVATSLANCTDPAGTCVCGPMSVAYAALAQELAA